MTLHRWQQRCLSFAVRLLTRRRYLVVKLLILLACVWLALSQLSDRVTFIFKSLQFDPEPQLSPREAKAVADAFALPAAVSAVQVVKRVHFMYRGYRLDERLRPFLTSWRQVYPDYKLYFWTDKEIEELLRRRYPTWRDLYHRQLSNYLEKSDTARALILHTMGGWYADIDAGSLKRADSVASEHALILPLEPYVHAFDNFKKRRLASNAIMYSVANHPFWMYLMRRLRDSLIDRPPRSSTLQAAFVTGPVLLTEVALLFMQAHSSNGCPGIWCPHLAKPVHFMPTYDDHTPYMRRQLRLYCKFALLHCWDFVEDCRRYQSQDFGNQVNPSQSYAYHAFLHLNERQEQLEAAKVTGDVRDWGLGIATEDEILADLA